MSADPYDADKPREACGVAGVWGPDGHHAAVVREMLVALQHRGQESAGIAVGTGDALVARHGAGTVAQALSGLQGLPEGPVAVGHVRYATHGARDGLAGAQPVVLDRPPLAVAHNGTLVDPHKAPGADAIDPGLCSTDSELLARLLLAARAADGADTPAALHAVLPRLRGAYALVLSDGRNLYGVRDPHGFRPLALGRRGDAWLLASETAAITAVGGEVVRELEPGEVLSIGAHGTASSRVEVPDAKTAACLFEYVYFARADSTLSGRGVYQARYRAGQALADYAPVLGSPRPVVVATPETARVAADGYAERAGLPVVQGLLRPGAVGRSFIAGDPSARETTVRRKLAPVAGAVAGQRVVLVDDSLVRGTTMRTVTGLLREAGAVEVHLRIASPPYRWPCFYGIDTGRPEELLAARLPITELAEQLGCDSVAFLSLDRLVEAAGGDPSGYCTACLTGRYPTAVPAGAFPAPAGLPQPGTRTDTALASQGTAE
ncbi:amidophosphoribosyltransferase [Streptomyces sp. PKU-EA00015]|uniref:amidophosphoribosyltransferase n=1 Tax=Streptomyces sp. PKU-EA00015 TaxID=2748326 RepID=UPI0015A460BD|nr:amidophosphoribosyltransferase [Streptomyces sp. PKU-EA00015]NWF31348.1 amidophosphoribosyltransferase [Streptomyces sp. PKU-EA00015]